MYFVTDDSLRWGFGLGVPLTAAQVDDNFWELLSRVVALEDHPEAGRGIDDVTIVSDQMTFHFSDSTTQTITVPVAMFHDIGTWPATTIVSYLDLFDYGGALYYVLQDHTTASTFDAAATDGSGHPLYRLIMSQPAGTMPAGGTAGQFLRKTDATDYNAHWYGSWLTDQQDVLVDTTIVDGDVLTWDGGIERWINKPPSLPAPSSGSLGGVESIGPVSHEWINSIGTDGVPTLTQPDFADLSGIIGIMQARQTDITTLGTSGSVTIDDSTANVFSVTPSGAITFTAPTQTRGAQIILLVFTSGTSSYTLSFDSNFHVTGTLATGTADSKIFAITFYSDGTHYYETSRTAAMS